MRKFLSLLMAVMTTVLVFGQSYGILVNGHTYFAGEPAGENEGFTQYLSHVQLQSGDYCQLYDAENNATWAVTLNSWSVGGFELNNDRYEVTVDGCYDFYIKLKYGQDELYIGNGSNCGEGQEIGGGEDGNAIKLTFTYYNSTGGDGSAKLSTVAAIFDAACQKYVDSVLVGTQVYAGRKYAEGNDSIFSNLKLGSSSAAGELKFALADPTEVDSIVFRAAMYASNEGGEGFKVNNEDFTLSAGKLIFEDKVWKPTGEVSIIDIVQNKASKGRFFLTSITIYPKESTPEPPVAAKFYVTGDSALLADAADDATLAWNPAAIKSEADTLVLNLKAEQYYKLKVTTDGTWNTAKGFNDLTEKPAGVSMDNDENIIFSLAEEGAVQVIYIAGEEPVFKIAGNFYVEPEQPTPNYYIIGAGEAFGEWSFVPVMQDTFLLNNLAAGDYMFRVALEEGNWENTKGYSDLTEKTEGLSANEDNNILFTLAEASDVAVVYNDSVFRVIGNFYVAPVVEPAKFYVTGDSALLADAASDATLAWNPAAIKSEADTLVLNLKAEQYYKLKVTADGTWNTAKGFNDLTENPEGVTMDNDENIIFSLAEEGAVQVIYIAGEEPVFKLAGNFYVEPTPEPVLTNGYYLVGTMNEWTPVAENLFVANAEAEGEFQLAIDLAVNDELKVVYVENDAIVTWFPAEGDNYVIDDHHNGATTMYFRPDYQGGEGWFAGCIYVAPTSTVDITNTDADTKAVKSIQNGILVIEKNNKTYNVMGQMLK